MKKFITFLILTLGGSTLCLSQISRNQTLSTNQDSTLCLSPYEIQLVSLDHAAMLYWRETSSNLDNLYKIEKHKTNELRRVLSFKDEAINSLRDAYNLKSTELELKSQELKFANKQITILKVKNTLLTIGVVGLTISTIYFAAF